MVLHLPDSPVKFNWNSERELNFVCCYQSLMAGDNRSEGVQENLTLQAFKFYSFTVFRLFMGSFFFGFVIQEGLKMLQNQCASWLIAF